MQRLLMATLIWASFLFALGCTSTYVEVPTEIKEVRSSNDWTDGKTRCQLRLKSDGSVWTASSTDLCHYKVGDTLK